jgi:hypothetical protein
VALVVPEPERAPDPETASVAPETASVAPETAPVTPEPLLVALVTLPVRSETTVVCEVIVEIAEVTVPIGSRTCAPAIAALLATPPSARMTRSRTRIAADRISHLTFTRFWRSKPRIAKIRREMAASAEEGPHLSEQIRVRTPAGAPAATPVAEASLAASLTSRTSAYT